MRRFQNVIFRLLQLQQRKQVKAKRKSKKFLTKKIETKLSRKNYLIVDEKINARDSLVMMLIKYLKI